MIVSCLLFFPCLFLFFCGSKCSQIGRCGMSENVSEKLITRHISAYSVDCQCVMAWWVAGHTRHIRASLPLAWRVAVPTRHTVTSCLSGCYAPMWRVTSFFRKSFCVVLSLSFPEFDWLQAGFFPVLCLLRLAFVRHSCIYYYIIMLQNDRRDSDSYVCHCRLVVA